MITICLQGSKALGRLTRDVIRGLRHVLGFAQSHPWLASFLALFTLGVTFFGLIITNDRILVDRLVGIVGGFFNPVSLPDVARVGERVLEKTDSLVVEISSPSSVTEGPLRVDSARRDLPFIVFIGGLFLAGLVVITIYHPSWVKDLLVDNLPWSSSDTMLVPPENSWALESINQVKDSLRTLPLTQPLPQPSSSCVHNVGASLQGAHLGLGEIDGPPTMQRGIGIPDYPTYVPPRYEWPAWGNFLGHLRQR